MTGTTAGQARSRRTARLIVGALIIVVLAIVGFLLQGSVSSSAPSLGGPIAQQQDDGAITEADGLLPNGTTVLDTDFPGVGNLRPELLDALHQAAADAAADGLELDVTSGWRSPAYQESLLREAVVEYGSEAEAARWVATADTSAHVSGDAVDIGPFDSMLWLSEHGTRYGLCQTYSNEPWHYELRPEAIDRHCPRPYADPTEDPRMNQ